jgi:hypothetical protein
MIESPKMVSEKRIAWTRVEKSTVKRGHDTRVVEMLSRAPIRAYITYLWIFGSCSWHISTLGVCEAWFGYPFPKTVRSNGEKER